MFEVGYIAGVFDLFHLGHLNLLKKAKENCKYLVVGVLTDELVRHFKVNNPYIPFDERLQIIESIKYVDRAIGVTFENIDKLDAWRQVQFDCQFSGSDYEHNQGWLVDKKRLEDVGATIIFFPYTKSTSSTQIKKIIQEN